MIDYRKHPRAYEEACLHRVIDHYVGFQPVRDFMGPGEIHFHGAWLEGSYPDTQLFVAFEQAVTGWIRAHAFHLWGELFDNGHGGREDPLGAIDLLTTWLEEPLPEGDPFKGEISYLPPHT